MKKEKTKVYIYTRVSTTMQIDGYSLDAQKSRMKAYAEFNDYEIVGEYEDAGKSGKSIEGRIEFNNMMEDIKSGNGQWLKSIKFKLPIIAEDMSLSLDNDTHVETVCTLSQSGTLKKILARSKQWI